MVVRDEYSQIYLLRCEKLLGQMQTNERFASTTTSKKHENSGTISMHQVNTYTGKRTDTSYWRIKLWTKQLQNGGRSAFFELQQNENSYRTGLKYVL
ncbi:MAG: hypothetical protein EZS28_008049 [Streblomastix strix]|uniref:Uncharacterized protein n=1 Tax=Streblomastix strix TaxID=222440 RepID=A0A5J4WN72_9EUKA|nr:MAG: hypothetical protein EZS28_008049 [Streblomastix strix]